MHTLMTEVCVFIKIVSQHGQQKIRIYCHQFNQIEGEKRIRKMVNYTTQDQLNYYQQICILKTIFYLDDSTR